MKLKSYKTERVNRYMIIEQIEFFMNETGQCYDCDYIQTLSTMNKKELIQVWVDIVTKLKKHQFGWEIGQQIKNKLL